MRIIGCGNRERGDDAVGILVAERLRELGVETEILSGETTALIEAWRGSDDVVVVDAVVTGAPSGTVQVWNSEQSLPLASSPPSSHGLGLAEAIELARALGCLPRRLRVYGIEGRQFSLGSSLSPEVTLAVEEVVQHILTQIHNQERSVVTQAREEVPQSGTSLML
jgi:hydrogenase maturation protease